MINKISIDNGEPNKKIQNKEKESEKETAKIDPFVLLSKDLENIKEDDDEEFTPIMSRIKRDKREKKKNKFNKYEEYRINNFSDIFKSNKERKLSFTKLSHIDLNSSRLNTLLALNPFCSDFKENIEKKRGRIFEYTK